MKRNHPDMSGQISQIIISVQIKIGVICEIGGLFFYCANFEIPIQIQEIIAGRAELSIVFQDAVCTAFIVLKPVNPGHLLIIPNEHATFLTNLQEDTGAHIFRIAQRLSAVLQKSSLKCEGVNPFLADGEAALQELFHVHLHVIPRFAGDGFGLKYSPGNFKLTSRLVLNELAEKIRKRTGFSSPFFNY